MNNLKVKAIFYDLDNTLYPQIIDVEQRIDFCVSYFELKDASQVKSFWLNEWLDNGPTKTNIIDNVIKEFSLSITKHDLIHAYRNYNTSLTIEPEINNLLRYNRHQGIRQFLITNGNYETQAQKIKELQLETIMDEIFIATGSHAKPSPFAFLSLLKKYNLQPHECMSVGDWYHVDGVASISAGINFIHLEGGPISEVLPSKVTSISMLTKIVSFLGN
ncbi:MULTISPECIES: HAD family hydrolase [unclassified Thermosynechococcus]|uniref:HAD family hydrolase n=1 Tax=unclassified Thermosynechococcus TaxID=2622553 RepID=UPI0028735A0F|nr:MULTISPECIES: HAD family hydrolase [unclassified Thermosynechococcus]WNC32644.1 HAD family hydrolase [Thermosynechococcus sp. PKX95]WNC35173.1 HAD family hydrolase [Thermosynechococcus sp. PKX91]WNC37691.1 HAD family hydrolase [Thermosynechococcus sp. WL11]WNC40212.1 HAD family hydrolase [Thermosynechococcus sp. WL17]WNC42732.1 HAD family hydrolase [Thermosynechococcus sp. WL15]